MTSGPELALDDERFPGRDPRYRRRRNYRAGDPSDQKALIVAQGRELRALVKHLDGISNNYIVELIIPRSMPLVYKPDDDLKPLNHYYLGDPEKVKLSIETVAALPLHLS